LAQRLRELPFNVRRLKTGTPPRIDGRSLDYSVMEIQPGDTPIPVFSFIGHASQHPQQIPCHITQTTERTKEIILQNLDKSAMYSGQIEGVGPRYCPSIEDKMVRFADKMTHQIFVEPEGLTVCEIYPNGISTSLPFDVQVEFVRSIQGFENAHITRPGYAIEYDFFDPRDLRYSLETKFIAGLFFAGQINGTTGYEEAAAQGLIAGMNAALQVQDKPAWCPRRDEAYMGVLIDDLITQGTQEPYRMFTSRAEFRLILREDNADLRLTEKGRELGLVDDERWEAFNRKREAITVEQQRLKKIWVHIDAERAPAVTELVGKPLVREVNGLELLRRPEVTYDTLIAALNIPPVDDPLVAEQVEVQTKYAGYIERQTTDIERAKRHDGMRLPAQLDYDLVHGLSTEVRQKLKVHRPETLGQAARISGVTPAAISLLLVNLKK